MTVLPHPQIITGKDSGALIRLNPRREKVVTGKQKNTSAGAVEAGLRYARCASRCGQQAFMNLEIRQSISDGVSRITSFESVITN